MLRGVKNTPCAPIKTNGPRYLPGLSQKSVSPFLMQGHHLGDFSRRPIRLMATRNPARTPVEVGTLSHYLQGFWSHPRWLFGISEPSRVWAMFSGPAPIILIIFQCDHGHHCRQTITKSSNKKILTNPPLIAPPPTSFQSHRKISLDKHTQAIPSQCFLNSEQSSGSGTNPCD